MLLNVGDRVRVKRDMEIENYTIPTTNRLGTVVRFDVDMGGQLIERVYVQLDDVFPALSEWENCLIWDREGGCHPLIQIITDLEFAKLIRPT